jgi:hypothetical protein
MWHQPMRYLIALCVFSPCPLTHADLLSFTFQPDTTEPPVTSKSGNKIYYSPPRQIPYIGYNAPSISSVMQGPKIIPPPDSVLLSTFKRKGGSSEVLTHRSKKKIDTKVLNTSNMAGALASAFQVMTFSPIFFLLHLVIKHPPFLYSLGLIGQSEQTNATNSDRGPILEPIQEASADDTLVESFEQARLDKTAEDIMDAILIEQLDAQPTEV